MHAAVGHAWEYIEFEYVNKAILRTKYEIAHCDVHVHTVTNHSCGLI